MPEIRPIDANALKDTIRNIKLRVKNPETMSALVEMKAAVLREIEAAPTIEAEPVRRGRWIYSDPLDYKDPNGVIHVHGMCSCCKLIYDFRDMTSRFRFCPNCGARMDATDTDVGGKGGADNG